MSYQKKRYDSEFGARLSKPTLMTSGVPKGYCDRIPGALLQCPYNFRCWACDYAARVKMDFKYDVPTYPPIDLKSVFADKAKVKYNYYQKVVALKPEALARLELKPLLYYQFFKCCDGPGCLPDNYVWEIDGYFIAYPDNPVTIRRSDVLGIPTFEACKRYDKYFFTTTVRECGYLSGGDALDCRESDSEKSDVIQLKL